MKHSLKSLFAAAVLLVNVVPVGQAFARPTGEAQGCGNCHYKSTGPMINASFGKTAADLGETLTLKVQITAVHPEAKRTGIWASEDGAGVWGLIDTKGTRIQDGKGVLHAEPKVLVDGKGEFSFKWTAPKAKGVSNFTIFSITGNTNGTADDDHNSKARISISYGCAAKSYYPDVDGDGFGDEKRGELSCDPIPDMITKGGDCKDDDKTVAPGNTEICNAVDDNCDGETDEGLDPGLFYKDEDGDGFAGNAAKAEFTCSSVPGYVSARKDCAPKDPDVNPDAREVPDNSKDDDCDGQTDEADDDDGNGGNGGNDGNGDNDGDSEDSAPATGCAVAPRGSFAPTALWMSLLGLGLFLRKKRKARA